MRPYGRRAPKPSTPTWTPDNNRDGRHIEKETVRRSLLELWAEADGDGDRFWELVGERPVVDLRLGDQIRYVRMDEASAVGELMSMHWEPGGARVMVLRVAVAETFDAELGDA